jgi:hypothetical protein
MKFDARRFCNLIGRDVFRKRAAVKKMMTP